MLKSNYPTGTPKNPNFWASKSFWAWAVLASLFILWLLTKMTGGELVSIPPNVGSPVGSAPEYGWMESKNIVAPVSKIDEVLSHEKVELPRRFRLENISFTQGSALLKGQSENDLDQLAKTLKNHPQALVRIEGFTSHTGMPVKNRDLSEARALKIKEELVKRGVREENISSAGLGASDPLTPESSPYARALNERIELVILKL